MDIDPERFFRNPFVIGAIGAAIGAWKFLPGATWLGKVGNVASGSAFAGFVAPAVTEWLKMTSPSYTGGAAFIAGLAGMSLTGAVLTASLKAIAETPLGQILTGWLSKPGSPVEKG